MIEILKTQKSEINIKIFLDMCKTMEYSCQNKYDNIIGIIRTQLKYKKIKMDYILIIMDYFKCFQFYMIVLKTKLLIKKNYVKYLEQIY